jgi:hypothetical protein
VNSLKRLFLVVALSLGMVGCASVNKMPLQANATAIDTTQKSILVARVKIKNDNHQSQQPNLCCVILTNQSKSLNFSQPTLLSEAKDGTKDYFVSMDVAPGVTKLNFVHFIRSVPMLIMATADARLDYDIDVPNNKIVYLGNIDAVIVPRTDDSQPRAGSVIPLIDQSVAGFSSGTFKINITDQYESDTKDLIAKFPSLTGKEIVKNVLLNKDQLPQPQASLK